MKTAKITTVGLLLMVALSGCSTTLPEGKVSEGPTVSPSESATSSPAVTTSTKDRFVNTEKDGVKYTNDIPLDGVKSNKNGRYAQTTVEKNASYMTYNNEIASDSLKKAIKAKKVSEKDVQDAQEQVMTFIAKESLDSPLNGGDDVGGWMKQHSAVLHPDFTKEIKSDLKSKDGGTFLVRGTSDEYVYYYDPAHGRMTSRSLELKNVSHLETDGYNALTFTVDFSTTMPSHAKKGDNAITELTSGTLAYSLIKDGGKWKLAAWQNSYNTKDLKE